VQLHGLTSSRARDETLRLDLTAGRNGLRVLRYDAFGHGLSAGSTSPADYEWDTLADDLLALLDAEFPGRRVHGVGQSMGTATLLTAAVRDPSRFASLSLGIPPTAWDTRAAQAADYEDSAVFVERSGRSAFAESRRDLPLPPAAEPDRPHMLPDVREEWLPAAFRGAAASDLPAREEIAALRIPTLVLAWTEDASHPESSARELHRLVSGSRIYVASRPEPVREWPAMISKHIECAAAAAIAGEGADGALPGGIPGDS